MPINVLAAVYGTNINGIDVTSFCQAIVDQSDDDIYVENSTFDNQDPDHGVTKSFGIIFTNSARNGGNPIVLGCQEGTTLDLVPSSPTQTTVKQNPLAPNGNIIVKYAGYGYQNNGNDVTAICQAFVNQGNLTMQVNNDVMGPDPSPGATKNFFIIYTVNGQEYAVACQEGTNITLKNS
jgi:hypothetical protein